MRIVKKLAQEWQNLFLEIIASVAPKKIRVENDVPYVSQFATPQFSEEILKNKVPKTEDPGWKDIGASSPEEYAAWVTTQCGMACTAMALKHLKGESPKLLELSREALSAGVYASEGEVITDMRYREFRDWVSSHGLQAMVYSRLSISGVQYLLSEGNLVMVSVNPNIRGYETAPKTQKGGHLVLVTGYDKERKTITLNNPSGFVSTNTQEKHTIPLSEFRSFYAGRGIALRS